MEQTDDVYLSISGAVSDESGWTKYIDSFMETQQQASAVGVTDDIERSRSSSGDDDEAQSPLPELVKPSEVSAGRLSLRKDEGRRKKKFVMMYDESLEDTATSPISSPKLIIDSRDSYEKQKNKRMSVMRFPIFPRYH